LDRSPTRRQNFNSVAGRAENTFQRVPEQRESGDQQNSAGRFHNLPMSRVPARHAGERCANHYANHAQCSDHLPPPREEPFACSMQEHEDGHAK
jgi:hypothetical protein